MDRDEIRRQLQESNRELREDIARRQVEIDIAETREPPVPMVVYKRRDDSLIAPDDGITIDDDAPFTEEQMDVLGDALAQIRADVQDATDATVGPLRERIAQLEGSVQALLSLLGGGDTKAIEAPVVRRLKAG